MAFKVRDEVYWQIPTRTAKVLERAGIIVAEVPAEQHPNNVGFGEVVSPNVFLRGEVSYLVQIPNTQSIFWLSTKTMQPLPPEKRILFEQQSPAQLKKLSVDHRDRLTLKRLCKKLNVEFTESKDFLHVPAMKKRFVFRVSQGIEYVAFIEAIKDL